MFMCSNQQKTALSSDFLFLTVFACAAINLVNLAFRTTIITDKHLTPAFIPFKVEVNNSLIFCHYKHARKNLPSFRSFTVYDSLSYHLTMLELPTLKVVKENSLPLGHFLSVERSPSTSLHRMLPVCLYFTSKHNIPMSL